MDGWWMDEQVDRYIDRGMDGWLDGQVSRWMDR